MNPLRSLMSLSEIEENVYLLMAELEGWQVDFGEFDQPDIGQQARMACFTILTFVKELESMVTRRCEHGY